MSAANVDPPRGFGARPGWRARKGGSGRQGRKARAVTPDPLFEATPIAPGEPGTIGDAITELLAVDPALLDDWYRVVGHELHDLGGKPHDPPVARRLLADVGAPDDVFDKALADPSTHDEVRADHQRVLDAGGFGVPTLFLGEQCLFGPVLVDPPVGGAALTLWTVVTGMAALPHVYELQRPKTAADAELIGRSLRPYVEGRDWVSINRGEVVDLSELTGLAAAEKKLPDTNPQDGV